MREAYLACLNEEAAGALRELACRGGGFSTGVAHRMEEGEANRLSEALAGVPVWDVDELACVRFLIEVGMVTGWSGFLADWAPAREDEVMELVRQSGRTGRLPLFSHPGRELQKGLNWDERDDATSTAPFRSPFANAFWNHTTLDRLLERFPALLPAVIRWRPEHFESIFADVPRGLHFLQWGMHHEVMERTDRFDGEILRLIKNGLARDIGNEWHHRNFRMQCFRDLFQWNATHRGVLRDEVMALAGTPEFAGTEEAVSWWLAEKPAEVMKLAVSADTWNRPLDAGPAYQRLLAMALEDIAGDGGRLLADILGPRHFAAHGLALDVHKRLLSDPGHPNREEIRQIYLRYAGELKGKKLAEFWEKIAKVDAGLFEKEWIAMASAKGQQLREIAAKWLTARCPERSKSLETTLVSSTSVDDRTGGATMLAEAGNTDQLKRLHATDPSKQVREEAARLLVKAGLAVEAEPAKPATRFDAFGDLEKSLAGKAKTIRPPTAPWLNAGALPPLFAKDGVTVSELARTFLFQLQAREASGILADEVQPLLEHLDRKRNAPFAHALLDQWFASDMKASTRWAVDVAGLTGDDSLIERLVRPIPDWCKQNAGKRAEWTVRAIALIGTPGALRELDALTHRYRNHRRYVAAAANEAIRALAAIQGISEDEIAERIVPDFGFDDAGESRFKSPAGEEVIARLRLDLKVAWQGSDGRESAKPPKDLPATEVKEWTKLFKQAVASQTVRLQRAMVEGRRWEPAAWRERFGHHPLFRCFAGSLVWAVYDVSGAMLRTFRRYPNGIFADAKGEAEEFDDVTSVGLPHPMDLDGPVLSDWAGHFRRFKVTPSFPQVSRPVERPDPLHGNRREIRIAEGKKLDAADLRSRMLGRGWSAAPTGHAGLVFGCFRCFPTAGIEAHLAVDGFYAGSGKGDEVELGVGLFAREPLPAMKVRPGTTPLPDDARVLRFDQVPAVVWSETMSDLKAILGT